MRASNLARRRFLIPRQTPSSPASALLRPSRLAPTLRQPPSRTIPQRPTIQTPITPRRRYHHDPRLIAHHLANAKPLSTPGQLKRALLSPSTRIIAVLAAGSAGIFYFANLETVPVSGRTRFNCYSPATIREIGETQKKLVLDDLHRQGGRLVPDWDPRTKMVRRVMAKLIPFSGMADENWEVFVIEDRSKANAFVLPGGKVFVFSGILPLARTDAGLAAVLGHEIAHNLADHTAERMSQSIPVNALMYSVVFLSALVGLAPLVMQVLGGSVMDIAFSRPMGRLQESEADYIGLMMMAEACYDPREAVAFWRRMDAAVKGQPPEWMSTHPSNQTRIAQMTGWLPKAVEKREGSDCRSTEAFADLFRRARETGFVVREAW